MTENKHTPGPWRYYRASYPVGPAIVPTSGPSIITFFNECPDLRSQNEHDANGILAATAPELLAACEAMAEALDQADDVWWLQDEADQIDAAIAKARGEA